MKKIVLLVIATSFLLAGCSTPEESAPPMSLDSEYLSDVHNAGDSMKGFTDQELIISGKLACEQLIIGDTPDQVFASMEGSGINPANSAAILKTGSLIYCPQYFSDVTQWQLNQKG